jgi:hypothetical protein
LPPDSSSCRPTPRRSSASRAGWNRCRPRSHLGITTTVVHPGSSAPNYAEPSIADCDERRGPLVEYWKAQKRTAIRRPGEARARAHHDCKPETTAAPLHRRRRCHRHCRAQDCRPEGAGRGAPGTLDVTRVRLNPRSAAHSRSERFQINELQYGAFELTDVVGPEANDEVRYRAEFAGTAAAEMPNVLPKGTVGRAAMLYISNGYFLIPADANIGSLPRTAERSAITVFALSPRGLWRAPHVTLAVVPACRRVIATTPC